MGGISPLDFPDPTTEEGSAYWQRRHDAERANELAAAANDDLKQAVRELAEMVAVVLSTEISWVPLYHRAKAIEERLS